MCDIPDGIICLNGNSLGPMSKAAPGVINIMRFGITPLFISEADIRTAVDRMEVVLRDGVWERAEFQVRSLVT